MSASRSSVPAVALSPTAMPMEAPIVTVVSPSAPSLKGCLRASSSRSATSVGLVSGDRSPTSTTNSSPPRRPSVSTSRTTACRRVATPFSSSSPVAWPSVSLIVLKLSRSMKRAATDVPWRVERASICSTRSTIRVRFGSSVSGSWVAMNASSSSRRESCSSVVWRSRSKHWHIRSRLNSTLSWSMSSASRSTPWGVLSGTAASRITSANTLRHQNMRRVTSCSEAARRAASSPKIRDVSRAESWVTSRSSPAIQRATATVELVQIRSKLCWTVGSTGSPEPWVRATVSARTSSARASTASPSRRRCWARRSSGVGPLAGADPRRAGAPPRRRCLVVFTGIAIDFGRGAPELKPGGAEPVRAGPTPRQARAALRPPARRP